MGPGALTQIVTSMDDGLGDLKGQQEVARIPLAVHRLDKTKHKVGSQTLQLCGGARDMSTFTRADLKVM